MDDKKEQAYIRQIERLNSEVNDAVIYLRGETECDEEPLALLELCERLSLDMHCEYEKAGELSDQLDRERLAHNETRGYRHQAELDRDEARRERDAYLALLRQWERGNVTRGPQNRGRVDLALDAWQEWAFDLIERAALPGEPISDDGVLRDRIAAAVTGAPEAVIPIAELDAPKTLRVAAGAYSIGSDHCPGLSKLIEEAGEVGQVAGKIQGFGGFGRHWDGSDLRLRLIEEMGDVLAAIRYVTKYNGVAFGQVEFRSIEKLALFEKWHAETAR